MSASKLPPPPLPPPPVTRRMLTKTKSAPATPSSVATTAASSGMMAPTTRLLHNEPLTCRGLDLKVEPQTVEPLINCSNHPCHSIFYTSGSPVATSSASHQNSWLLARRARQRPRQKVRGHRLPPTRASGSLSASFPSPTTRGPRHRFGTLLVLPPNTFPTCFCLSLQDWWLTSWLHHIDPVFLGKGVMEHTDRTTKVAALVFALGWTEDMEVHAYGAQSLA